MTANYEGGTLRHANDIGVDYPVGFGQQRHVPGRVCLHQVPRISVPETRKELRSSGRAPVGLRGFVRVRES